MLRDAIGEQVKLERPAQRIISLAPNITETLFAIGAGKNVVARSSYCSYPPEALALDPVGDMQTVDYEKIVALKPDLVLMTWAGNIRANYFKLRDLGIQACLTHDSTIAETLGAIDTIGWLTGHRAEARELRRRIESTIDSIAALAAGDSISTFIVIDKAPLITLTTGFIAEALDIAGGRNIAPRGLIAYPQYSREELLRQDPEVIIIPSISPDADKELIETYPEWKRLRAVRNNRLYVLSVDIVTRPGPRLGECVKLLYRALHGEDPAVLKRF